MSKNDRPLRVALVGPCTSGKSTLAKALRAAGYEARQPAQEHSYVPAMWQKLTQPDILIYLDVDYENVMVRRPKNPGSPERLAEQHQRLNHARQHCDFYLDTSAFTSAEVQAQVLTFLSQFSDDSQTVPNR
jgi:shikimate kinase